MRTIAESSIHKAAWLYYGHGLRQDEVAQRLGISRATVVTYLRRAREIGAVNIQLQTGIFREAVLSRMLEDHFGLSSFVIVPDKSQQVSFDFPFAAGMVLLEHIGPNAKIALAWGETVYSIVEALPETVTENVTVLQMCGNLGAPFQFRPDECTLELARKLKARGENIYAPLILSSEELANSVRCEPIVAEQLAHLSQANIAIFAVGSCDPESHVVRCGAMTAEELAEERCRGAAGMIAGRIIDTSGHEVSCSYNRRLISIDPDALRSIPVRLVVIDGMTRLHPLLAALEGGFATHVVTTHEVATTIAAMHNIDPDTPTASN